MANETVNVYECDKITLKNKCEPGWARILLREDRASVISHNPFSIAMKDTNTNKK